MKEDFVSELKTYFLKLPNEGPVELQWYAMKNVFIEARSRILGLLKAKRRDWISEHAWVLIKRRYAKEGIEQAKPRGAKYQTRLANFYLIKEVKKSKKLADETDGLG